MTIRIIESNAITEPGFYRMPASVYHRDPCPSRSLSSSVLHTLLTKSPMHANAHAKRAYSATASIGSAVHKLMLEYGDDIAVISANDWRTNAAKEQREVALNNGQIPLLEKDYAAAHAIAAPLRLAIENFTGFPMKDCHRELVLVWQEEGKWRRAMLDIVTPDLLKIVDAKTTKLSVNPLECAKRVYNAYNIQNAYYLRGLNHLDPENEGRRDFYFLFGEQTEPYAVSPPIKLSESGAEMSREQVEFGCKLWDSCVESGDWFGYSGKVYVAQPTPWALSQWADGVIAAQEAIEEGEGE